MPKAQNVLIAAVYLALNLWYSIIYLTWCDYSRLEGICLDKNNNICSIDQHFYWKERIKWEFKFHKVLQSLSLAFKWHILLSDYAKYLWREIYNASEKSYIDAYKKYHI